MSTDIESDALQDIKGMTPKIMKLLIEEGFSSPHQVAMASPDGLTRVQGISDNKARQVIYATGWEIVQVFLDGSGEILRLLARRPVTR